MAENDYYGWGLPFNASAHGAGIDQLIYIFHGFMAVLFVGWLTYLILALVKFRARPGHTATYKLNHFKAPTYIEVGVALFEAVLLVAFAFPLFNTYRNDLPNKSTAMEVRVVGEQFAWNIHYPGADGVFGSAKTELVSTSNSLGLDPDDTNGDDDIVSINRFNIPVHKPVIVHLTSKDVIHSFFIPVMRVKHDMIPGQSIPIWFEAAHEGKFEIACAQLCGLGHYRMRGFFNVMSQEKFDAWFEKKAKKKAKKLAKKLEKARAK